LLNQGIVYKDNEKMSKSKGNIVTQDEVSKKYGIDTARLFLMFVASPEKQMEWNDEGIEGAYRTIKKIISLKEKIKGKADKAEESKVNIAIKKVTNDLEVFDYPHAVISITELVNSFSLRESISKQGYEVVLKLISVFCPHVAEELWNKIGNKGFISLSEWPKADEKKIDEKLEEQEKQIDKLISDISNILRILESRGEKRSSIKIFAIPNELKVYEGAVERIKRSFNFDVKVLNIKDAKDTEKKIKAQPGKPGILVE